MRFARPTLMPLSSATYRLSDICVLSRSHRSRPTAKSECKCLTIFTEGGGSDRPGWPHNVLVNDTSTAIETATANGAVDSVHAAQGTFSSTRPSILSGTD